MAATAFQEAVYRIVQLIPPGNVATYGQIAWLAGYPRAARAVGNALHVNPLPDEIPCFRVVSSSGRLSGAFAFGGPGRQAELLREDGVSVFDGKADLERCLWIPEYHTSPLLSSVHAFSTRLGGKSRGIYASLNLGMNRGDDPENVRENWRYFSRIAGFGTERFVFKSQVHGNTVKIASSQDLQTVGDGLKTEEADGLVTAERGLPLAVFTADCAPLLMEDPEAGVIAAVHCGWRSTAADIMGEAVRAMRLLGAAPARIRAVIGPCLRAACFETGPEVPQAMENMLRESPEGLWRPEEGHSGKYLVDLTGIIHRRLRQLGLSPEHLGTAGGCTLSEPDRYWSHRYTRGLRGSQASVIMLPLLR